MSKKNRIVALIAAALVVVMGVLGVTVLPARASADQSDWTPTHATDEQLKGVLCYVDDPVSDGTSVRYYFRAEDKPGEAPALTLDDGRTLTGQYDYSNNIDLGRANVSKVVFKDYVRPRTISFAHSDDNYKLIENKCLTAIEGLDKVDTSEVTEMNCSFYKCSALESVDLSHFDTSKVGSMKSMFSGCAGLKNIDISRLDLSACTSFEEMFSDCSSLESADISNSSTSSLAAINGMFYQCSKLHNINLNGLDTSSVKSMQNMFYRCSSLESIDLSSLDTSKVTNMRHLLDGCTTLKEVNLEGLDTSSVEKMDAMFSYCSSLESLDVSKLDTTSATDMSDMFQGCKLLTSIDVSKFNTANVTNMGWMFSGCWGITSLDVSKFDTSKVKNMNSMFTGCSKLQSLDVSHFDTSMVEVMNYMFNGCYKLQAVDVSNFNLKSVKSMQSMFNNCSSLKSIDMSRSEVTDVNARYMFSGCEALENIQLFHGSCSVMEDLFASCKNLKNIDVSMISRSNTVAPSFRDFQGLFRNSGVEQLRTRGDIFSADYTQTLDKTQLKKITIVANSGDLTVPDFNSLATMTISGKKINPIKRWGEGSETADVLVDMMDGGTLAGGTEDVDWYLQALTHDIRFYPIDGKPTVYKVADGDPFNEKAPDISKDLPPYARSNGWFLNSDSDSRSFDEAKASGDLDHIDRDWYFSEKCDWRDEDSEYHPANSYVVRVPSKISYEHQRVGIVDVSTPYDVSVSGLYEYASPKMKLELSASLSGFDGLNASVSGPDNGDISSRLLSTMELSEPSDDESFVAGKQFKDILHLSGSVDSAKSITGHITYSCKLQVPDPTPGSKVAD